MTTTRILPAPDDIGTALTAEILAGLDSAIAAGRRFVLGCPGGRSLQPTYRALAGIVGGRDLSGLVIAMMDDYLVDGGPPLRRVDPGLHYSCERFGRAEIAGPLSTAAAASGGRPIDPAHVWLPDPADPAAYDRRLADAGGVDLFLVASGASDGHVAFCRPGSPLDGGSSVIELAETTRRDNLATFPDFRSLDDVPRYGVSVGLGTIRRSSRAIRMVLTGEGKRAAAARLLATDRFDPAWPASFVHESANALILLDEAAAGRSRGAASV